MKELAKYLECAAIVGTHGVRGTVRLENRCDTPKVLASLKKMYAEKSGEYVEMKVLSSSVQKNMVLTHLEGIDTLEAAEALRGTVLYADRKDIKLRPGAHFVVDLIGLPVIDDETGEEYGILRDVISPGAQQIYVVGRESGDFMIPAVDEFIKRISLGEDSTEGIYVKLIEGFLD